MRQPLVAPCAALAIGIAVARTISFSFTETLISAIGLAALAAVGFVYRGSRAGRAACLLAFLFVGAQRASLPAESTERRVDQVFLRSGIAREVPLRLRGWVREPPEHFDDADRIVIEAEALYKGSPVWGGVRLTLNRYPEDPPLEIEYGEQIELLARFRELRNFDNPGSFDRVRFLNRQGLFIGAVARPQVPLHRLGNSRANSVAAYVWRGRGWLARRFDAVWGAVRPSRFCVPCCSAIAHCSTATQRLDFSEQAPTTHSSFRGYTSDCSLLCCFRPCGLRWCRQRYARWFRWH